MIKKAMIFPVIVVALLLSSVVFQVGMAVYLSSDVTHGVAPRFYERAVAWDNTRAHAQAAAEAGLRVEKPVCGPVDAVSKQRPCHLVVDYPGSMSAQDLSLLVSHNGRITQEMRINAQASAENRWQFSLPSPRPGLWNIAMDIPWESAAIAYRFQVEVF